MSTRSRARQRPPLIDPVVWEGECPSSHCRDTYQLNAAGQLPEHAAARDWPDRRRCPCSGWLARNPRPRRYFYVEGVQFL
jgi:hypothetical protein